MSPELLGVIIGGSIGVASTLIGLFVNHWLELRRDRYNQKLEAEREFRKKLTEGLPTNLYNKGMEKLYSLIDQGKLPRAYALDPKFMETFLEELNSEGDE